MPTYDWFKHKETFFRGDCLTHHVKSIEGAVTVHWEGHIALADKSVHYRNALPLSPPLHVQSGGFVMTDLVIKWESCWVSYNTSIPPASLSPQTHTHQMCCYCPVFWDCEVVVVYISVFFVLAIQNNMIHQFFFSSIQHWKWLWSEDVLIKYYCEVD